MSDFICLLLALIVVAPFFVWIGQVDKAKVELLDHLIDARHKDVRRRRERAAKREKYEDKLDFNPEEVLDPFAENGNE